MNIRRKQLVNVVLIIAIVVFLFTPAGFYIKVYLYRLLAGNPSVISIENQNTIVDYNWQLVDLYGSSINLESTRGQVVLINFWATWCPPCVAEMPSFQKLVDDYGDTVAFLFVAEDDPEKVKGFLRKQDYRLPVYFNDSNPPSIFQSSAIPVTYIIDKRGHIVVSKTGTANWNSEKTRELLDRLFNEN